MREYGRALTPAVALELLAEGNKVLDSLHDRFLFDKSSDWRIANVDEADARLRAIMLALAGGGEAP